MSLAGRLEEIELAELLHFLALNNRTGKVMLSRRDAPRARGGAAGADRVRGLELDPRELRQHPRVPRAGDARRAGEALEKQHLAADGRRLGDLLVESGAISEEQLQEALKHQTGLVVQELCRWRSGYFKFEVTPVASSGDIGVDAEELVVTGGVATDQVLLEAMTQLDEARPRRSPICPRRRARSPARRSPRRCAAR